MGDIPMVTDPWAPLLAAARERDAAADPLVHYERSALFYLQSVGAPSNGAFLSWHAWAADSIVWTIGRLRAGYPHEAVRGLFQVYEYTGRAGGFLPAGLSDARDALRNHIEKLLRPDVDPSHWGG